MYGHAPSCATQNSFLFVSKVSITSKILESLHLKKRIEPVRGCRTIQKKDMKLNDICPKVEVDPETYEVTIDGVPCQCGPVSTVPMGKSTFLF